MEERIILSYFVQMALGLDFMHRNRVLHRDLKTQNIFMLGNGRVGERRVLPSDSKERSEE